MCDTHFLPLGEAHSRTGFLLGVAVGGAPDHRLGEALQAYVALLEDFLPSMRGVVAMGLLLTDPKALRDHVGCSFQPELRIEWSCVTLLAQLSPHALTVRNTKICKPSRGLGLPCGVEIFIQRRSVSRSGSGLSRLFFPHSSTARRFTAPAVLRLDGCAPSPWTQCAIATH